MPIDIATADEYEQVTLVSLYDASTEEDAGRDPGQDHQAEESTEGFPPGDLVPRLIKELNSSILNQYRPEYLSLGSTIHRYESDDALLPPVTTSIELGLDFDPKKNSLDPSDQELLDSLLIREAENEDDEGSASRRRRKGKGKILQSSWNLGLAISQSSICRGISWCNLRQAVVWGEEAPEWVRPQTRLTNGQIVEIGNLISKYFEMTWPPKTIDQQIDAVAKRRTIEPVQDWLKDCFSQALASGRGIPDPSDWLIRYCGAQDNKLNRWIGRWWLVSVVARSMQPGTKVDHMLVLQGPQASRKTSLVFALMPRNDWVCELTSNLDTTDGARQLDGRVLAFDDELKKTRKKKSGSDEEDVKSFLTRQQDQVRTMYSPRFETTKRRVTFIGSCNPDVFLSDPTGNRRYWPVRIAKCDDAAVAANRDVIWAGAFALWLLGERFWPETDEELDALRELVDEATERNPWAQDYLRAARDLHIEANFKGVEITQIFERFKGEAAQSVRGSEMSKKEVREIADVLKAAGWTKRRAMLSRDRATRWFPPEPSTEKEP